MNIVILDANTLGEGLDLNIFKNYGNLTVYGFTSDEEVVSRIKDMDVIITNKVHLNETNLSEAPTVKLICETGTGTNNIDTDYTTENSIVVSNIVGYSTESVAQHTFAMLFYLYEKMAFYDHYVKSGTYAGDQLFSHYSQSFSQLHGKTWGIIGMGNIGKRVASIAEAFGCKICYYSTSGKNNRVAYTQLPLNSLLRQSDIVSIHAPFNSDTDNLIDADAFSRMKSSAVLLNLGRGRIVNEADLYDALMTHKIAAAGLDVLEHEPMNPKNPLLGFEDSTRLLITPHIGWASIEARKTAITEVALNIEAFLDGCPRNQVI